METEKEVVVTEETILSMGFKPKELDVGWPYTMIYEKDNYTIQYINPWGQGAVDEGWLLKKDGVGIPFKGYRNTAIGKLPNAYILFVDDLNKIISIKQDTLKEETPIVRLEMWGKEAVELVKKSDVDKQLQSLRNQFAAKESELQERKGTIKKLENTLEKVLSIVNNKLDDYYLDRNDMIELDKARKLIDKKQ
jgi:hypothetical protein